MWSAAFLGCESGQLWTLDLVELGCNKYALVKFFHSAQLLMLETVYWL